MNPRAWFSAPRHIRLLLRAHIAVVAVLLGLASWWGVRFGTQTAAANSAKESARASMQAIAQLRGSLEEASHIKSAPSPSGLQAIGAFQNAVERSASQRACEITEFQAASDLAPYLTRFKKVSKKNEWLQADVRLSLKGRLSDIIATLNSLTDLEVPFELNAVTLSREESDAYGESGVVAKVELRVLTKRAGDKA